MAIAATALLDAWDHAAAFAPPARAVALLSGMQAEGDIEAMARLPLGARDARLLRLRQELFGDRMRCLTACRECGTQFEFAVSASLLLQQATEMPSGKLCVEGLGYRVELRLPDSTDLIALFDGGDANDVQAQILSRCVIEVQGPDGPAPADTLPPHVVELIANEIERRDPLATVWIDLHCDHCGRQWRTLFDIASIIWSEVEQQSAALLQDVHALASAYGWPEHEVLQMSAARRARYLGIIGA